MPRILLVEDDHAVAGALSRALTDAGHAVRPVGRASDALKAVVTERPDLVILDLGLPDMDGLDALRMIRAICDAPVIVATARRSDSDIVRLLNAGADDYVTKPFSSVHMAARINAVLRRGRSQPVGPQPSAGITIGGLQLIPDQHFASVDGRAVQLTRKEYELLAYLARRVGKVVTRHELAVEIWGQAGGASVDVHVSWLRRKLGESATSPRFLRTIRGVGVMLVNPDEPVGSATGAAGHDPVDPG